MPGQQEEESMLQEKQGGLMRGRTRAPSLAPAPQQLQEEGQQVALPQPFSLTVPWLVL
jgi:hypothetical protein